MTFRRKLLFFYLLISPFTVLFAQIPQGYYNSAIGKSGRDLQVALSAIIDSHRVVGYDELWYYYTLTDLKPDGTIWDIYTDPYCSFLPTDHGTVGSGECYSYNREHVFCQSWFGNESGAPYSDMFHIYPVDAWINSTRNNLPYGEVANPTKVFQNGSRFGPNSFVGIYNTPPSTNAFEPIQEFKGDIARTFFYMATRYMFEDANFSTSHPMTNKSQLQPWALEMLKNWAILDPVSQKEIDRNNAIYQIQQNRNPYIDYPELINLVWGNDSLTDTFQPGFVPTGTKPRVIHFAAPTSQTIVIVFDSNLVRASAENSLNYAINGGISVDSAILSHGNQVTLLLENPLTIGLPYYMILRNIQSTNGYFIRDTSIVFVYGYSEYHSPITSWTFDSTLGAPNTPLIIEADINYTPSPAFMYFDGTHGSSIFITGQSGNQLNAFPGTIIGDPRIANAVSGQSLALVNETANQKSFVLQFSGKYWEDFIITLACRRTLTGFYKHVWEWSIDGQNYDTLPANTVPEEILIFELQTIDLQNIEELNRQDSIFIRVTLDSASSNSGNNRFDNITIHAQKCMVNYSIFDTILTHLPYSNHGFHLQAIEETGNFTFSRVGALENGCDSLIELHLYVIENEDPPTIIQSFPPSHSATHLTIYPNPTHELINLKIEGVNGEIDIIITDINGKILLRDTRNIENNEETFPLILKNLSRGIYLLTIRGENIVTTSKVVIY